jgi:hypothetical protein
MFVVFYSYQSDILFKNNKEISRLIPNNNPTLWYCQSSLSKNIDKGLCLYVLVSPLFVEQLVKVSE